ncbi:uncharacterized protein F4822DRAFT_304556 [Hypoxylon trugodes]|uniref:uncharacterized protein n=1 Tax=Hypoxylon trugodes TaxID=326681 RepID=UPI00219704B9|nr:uncharacterized protein F4822DRAFT_304556 [Hypoxylon trugodes]KAI1386064.1 hypothetical protein F4822DRAFT_304556 [Hypoxylon trugodes]
MGLIHAGCGIPNLGVTIAVAVFTILRVADLADAVSLPPPTGPYQVGVRKYIIEHYNDHDPVAPNNVSTAFLATVFYPTLDKPGAPKPYLNPETAAIFEQLWNYTAGTLSSITSTIQENATFMEKTIFINEEPKVITPPYPTILFGPGAGGPPVEGDTIILSELASYGYAVIGLDHPYEQPFIRFPNGTAVEGIVIDYNSIELITDIYDTRLVDNAALLEALPGLIREHQLPFNITHIGAFGYSLGGAAALGSLKRSSNIASGLNLDGTLFGDPASNTSAADEQKPAFLFGSESAHGSYTGDPTWASFPNWQTGPYWRTAVNGSTHHDYCDDGFWKTLEPGADQAAGSINGTREVQIMNTYVKAFFDYTLLGKNSSLLDGPSPGFPEVAFFDES